VERVERKDANMLLTLLWEFPGSGASDPRDKIYSLLGLLESVDETRSRTMMSMGYDPDVILL
jgi:hypothetical protein